MYAVILAGGSGTRLWPLSRTLFPKQCLQLAGDGRTLFQATVERALRAVAEERVIVVTHVDQAAEIRRQLALMELKNVCVLEEPQACNTAPAIALAARHILRTAGPDAVMAVLPSDHLIVDSAGFASLLQRAEAAARTHGLVIFGIAPTGPETGYGYIRSGRQLNDELRAVEEFVEKPDRETAQRYCAEGRYFWNSGMFVFSVGALLEQYRCNLPDMHAALSSIDTADAAACRDAYSGLVSISIDYGILEKASGVVMLTATIGWSDLGSWEACYQTADHDENANSFIGRVCAVNTQGTLIRADARLVGAVGVKDMIIVDTADALLVCDRSRVQDVKKIVDQLTASGAGEAREHRTVYCPWGSYTCLEIGTNYQVKRINVNPGARLSLQRHRHRAENWVVVAGEAFVTIDNQQIVVRVGESVAVPLGARHRIENKGAEPLTIIEVQDGSYLGEDDIIRYEDDYGRTTVAAGFLSNNGGGNLARERCQAWLASPALDPDMRTDLEACSKDAGDVEAYFGHELVFGTGGMRGLIGPGSSRMNRYTVRRVTQGLANCLNAVPARHDPRSVAIAYDTRRYSVEFAEEAALVLAANGIKALLFSGIRPTPLLSYAVRELGCDAGIVITASHNSREYNGYKVYGPDGGQAVSPLIDELIAAITPLDFFDAVKIISREAAVQAGLLELISPELDKSYLEKVRGLSLSSPRSRLSVVYTALHGTGSVHIAQLLSESGVADVAVVPEQAEPDPEFSTVRVPNPEDPAALNMALALAGTVGADIVLATDPDADRVGTAVRVSGNSYQLLSGNQVGALLIEYICTRLSAKSALPPDSVVVTTIVTGELGRRVAESYGLRTIETLTGFKFIGEKIKHFGETGTPSFLCGYEESCGYLTGTFVRDKDAVIATFLIAEMAAWYKDSGKTLLDVLEELHCRHGYHAEDLLSVELNDIAEAERYVAAFDQLAVEYAGRKIMAKRDFQQRRGWDYTEGREYSLDLPVARVLHYRLVDGSWFAVRPSGTEPKVKFYLGTHAATSAEALAQLARLRAEILARQ